MKPQIKIPSPLNIAFGLTLVVFAAAALFTNSTEADFLSHLGLLTGYWYDGIWSLLSFTMQMVLILVFGHMIALSPWINRFAAWFISGFNNMAMATTAVLIATLFVGFFNWGLGLIFGAVVARKLGEYAHSRNLKINYPLVGAAGYSGLMIWHGGLSGSAPLTVAAQDHFLMDKIGVISTSETVFSMNNLLINGALIVVLAIFVLRLSSRKSVQIQHHWELDASKKHEFSKGQKPHILVLLFGFLMIAISIFQFVNGWRETGNVFAALNLNFINFFLFGLVLLFLGNFASIELAVSDASKNAAGILIQFPLYAGIMGIMKSSGMIGPLSDSFIAVSNESTYALFTMLGAGLVNLVIPSGGGQWAVQGPIIIEAAQSLGVAIPKSIMALAYGDQLTNMIQPFWALPLLGITKLKASELLPYTFKFMLVGLLIYGIGLWLW